MDQNEILAAIERLDDWLDEYTSNAYKIQPMAQDMARVAKAGEEAGEAFEAFLGWTGQNPRKGVSKTLDDVLSELADVVLSGVLGIQHFTKDKEETKEILLKRLTYRLGKIPDGQ
jgi:NTP pyrophosphatase (non-canonical NTP hydrolase)